MITEEQFQEALKVVDAYHSQVFKLKIRYKRSKAVDIIEQVKAASSPQEVLSLARNDERKTVQDAAVKKIEAILLKK